MKIRIALSESVSIHHNSMYQNIVSSVTVHTSSRLFKFNKFVSKCFIKFQMEISDIYQYFLSKK